MTQKERVKAHICQSLHDRAVTISVPYYDAVKVFESVIAEDKTLPKMRYTFEPQLVGGVFHIEYGARVSAELTTSPDRDLRIDSAEELEEALRRAIFAVKDKIEIQIRSDIDVAKECDRFCSVYHGFFSNLIGMQYETVGYPRAKYRQGKIRLQYRIGRVKLRMMENALNAKISELGKQLFVPEMSAEAKALIAHNYLLHAVTYWKKEEPNALERSYMQSAYGALINGKCVCQGYAEAFKRILDAQGVRCEVICGKIKGSTTHHAWNMIQASDRQWYHVDVTWDDGGRPYEYFGLNDMQLRQDRLWSRPADMICKGDKDLVQLAKQHLRSRAATYRSRGISSEYWDL